MTSALDTSRAACVSLFTREWIEICLAGGAAPDGAVRLPLYEGVD